MFSNILVPLDGSELGEKALDMAKGLANSFKATVHLMQVVSRKPELEARRQSGAFFQTGALELELDQARQLIDSQLGKAFSVRLDSPAISIRSGTALCMRNAISYCSMRVAISGSPMTSRRC